MLQNRGLERYILGRDIGRSDREWGCDGEGCECEDEGDGGEMELHFFWWWGFELWSWGRSDLRSFVLFSEVSRLVSSMMRMPDRVRGVVYLICDSLRGITYAGFFVGLNVRNER